MRLPPLSAKEQVGIILDISLNIFIMHINLKLSQMYCILIEQWPHFILSGFNYVLTFKLTIWYNALIVYMFLHVY